MNKENIRETLLMAALSVAFFSLITDAIFPFTMIVMKVIYVMCGILSTIAFLGCISKIFSKNKNNDI